jgi:hypothetical protein
VLEDENYKLRIIDSLAEIDTLRDKWQSFQWHPNSDIDYYKQYIQSKSETTPYIVVIERGLDIVAIFVGRISDREVKLAIGYKNIFKSRFRSLTFIYGGILGNVKHKEVNIFISHLNEQLKGKKVEVIYLDDVDIRTEFYQNIKLLKQDGLLNQKTPYNLHWRMTLPKTMDDFYNGLSYKFRKNIRRSTRNLYEKYKNHVEIKCFTSIKDLPYVIDQNEAIAQKTYQRGLGVGFEKTYLSKSLMEIAANHGWMKCYILYINDEAIAFDRVYKYNNSLFLQDGGYNPDFKDVEPGTNLFIKILEDSFGKQQIDYIDFGFGDAPYKRRFCDSCWHEQTIIFFGKTFKCIAISVLLIILKQVNKKSIEFLKYLKIYEKVKHYWRIHSIKN